MSLAWDWDLMEVCIEPFEGRKISIVTALIKDGNFSINKTIEEIPYSIVDASYIMDSLQIITAAAAVLASAALVTKNIHSELLFRLSPSTNVEKTLSLVKPNAGSEAAIFVSFDLSLDQIKSKIIQDYGDKIQLDDSLVIRPNDETIRKVLYIQTVHTFNYVVL